MWKSELGGEALGGAAQARQTEGRKFKSFYKKMLDFILAGA